MGMGWLARRNFFSLFMEESPCPTLPFQLFPGFSSLSLSFNTIRSRKITLERRVMELQEFAGMGGWESGRKHENLLSSPDPPYQLFPFVQAFPLLHPLFLK
ncbi:hypothetical protein NE237_005861 [Protea cynaroides]|uniref:Uncharacterized protein n=1 Tax=Protea cynaroides TaxID=273540 RepID=A0A9Q0QUW5_9MAGN|nr:hypothetical protein NE237_005861 [Protea cynaroides]